MEKKIRGGALIARALKDKGIKSTLDITTSSAPNKTDGLLFSLSLLFL